MPTPSATPTLTNVAASVTSVTVLASNAARLGAVILNDSTSQVFLKYGTTASATSFAVRLGAGETLEIDQYTGRIDGIWTVANGSARVTELTA